MDRRVGAIIRETFHSSLELTREVLAELGLPEAEIERTVETFRVHDELLLHRQHAIHTDEGQLRQTALQAAAELEGLFRADEPEGPPAARKVEAAAD
jgi:voltage-gated potassium channel Kch